MKFDWSKPAAGDARQKERFHSMGRTRLRQLAKELGFDKSTYEVRSNYGGPAVSGEVTLHHDRVYIQVAQGSMGSDMGIMLRTCEGRSDYTGGRNHFETTSKLDDIPALARRVRTIMPEFRTDEHLDTLSDEEEAEYFRGRRR